MPSDYELSVAMLPFMHMWLDYIERNTFMPEDNQINIIEYINQRCDAEGLEACFKTLYDTYMKGVKTP